jgi:3-oxoadipate enol-lactonase
MTRALHGATEAIASAPRTLSGDAGPRVELRGHGTDVTIINSPFSGVRVWHECTKGLAARHRILTYDPWSADDTIGSSPTIERYVSELAAVLDSHGIEKTFLVGTSLSTLICRDFALAFGPRVAGLVLVGPMFGPFGHKRRRLLLRSWLASLEIGGPACLFDHLYPLFYSDRTIENGCTAAYLAVRERFLAMASASRLYRSLRAALATADDPARLKALTCPVLIVAGDGDVLSSATALGGSGLIRHARFERLDFAGHAPFFEAPAAFDALLKRFVEEISS